MGRYRKYVYWLDSAQFHRVSDLISAHGSTIYETRKAVCVALSKRVNMGVVHPEAWDRYELCKRQLSWYRYSIYFGKTLLVTSEPIAGLEIPPQVVLQDTKFRPPRLPDKKGYIRLIQQESYQVLKPQEWEDIDSEDPELYERWLKIMGVRGMTYKELFVIHCANHANFIEPQFFITKEGEKVPYSIDKTAHICSACLEFFDILGGNFRKKLVVPCPGAVLFAGLAPNRYYEVVNNRP